MGPDQWCQTPLNLPSMLVRVTLHSFNVLNDRSSPNFLVRNNARLWHSSEFEWQDSDCDFNRSTQHMH